MYCMYVSVVLKDALRDLKEGVEIQFRSTDGLFSIRRLQAKTKVSSGILRDLVC
jgi:hypothetical protein